MSDEYSELRARIAKLGMTQTGLARRMKELGDDRDEKNILRSIQRMIAGDARVSGEMRAMLGLMEQVASGAPQRSPSANRHLVTLPLEDLVRLHDDARRLVVQLDSIKAETAAA